MNFRKLAALLLSMLLLVSALSMATLPAAAADTADYCEGTTEHAYKLNLCWKGNGDTSGVYYYLSLPTEAGKTYQFKMYYAPVSGPGFNLRFDSGSNKAMLMSGNTVNPDVVGVAYDSKTTALTYTFTAQNTVAYIHLFVAKQGDNNTVLVANPTLTDVSTGTVTTMTDEQEWVLGNSWNAWPYDNVAVDGIGKPVGTSRINLCYKKDAADSASPSYTLSLQTVAGKTYSFSALYQHVSGPGFAFSMKNGSSETVLLNGATAANASYDPATAKVTYTFTAASSEVVLRLKSVTIGDNNTANIGSICLTDTATGSETYPSFGSAWTLQVGYNSWPFGVTEIEDIAIHQHTYTNACDSDCDTCGELRDVSHVYDNDADAGCNVCGDLRDVGGHIYTDDQDISCNKCGELRQLPLTATIPSVYLHGYTAEDDFGWYTALSGLTVGKTYTLTFRWNVGEGSPFFYIRGSETKHVVVGMEPKNGATFDRTLGLVTYTFTADSKTPTIGFRLNSAASGHAAVTFGDLRIVDENGAIFYQPDTTPTIPETGWGWTGWYNGRANAQGSDYFTFADKTVLELASAPRSFESFAVNNGTLSPSYQPWIVDYTTTVPAGTTALEFDLSAYPGTSYEIRNNGNFVPGKYSFVQVIATPEASKAPTSYTICVYVEPQYDSLSDLTVGGYDINFDPSVREYAITVPHTQGALDLSWTLGDAAAAAPIVDGNGDFRAGQTSDVVLAVENKDGSFSYYTIHVTMTAHPQSIIPAVQFMEWNQDCSADTTVPVTVGKTYAVSFLFKEVVGNRVNVSVNGNNVVALSAPTAGVTFNPNSGRYTYVFTAATETLSIGISAFNYNKPDSVSKFEAWIADFEVVEIDPLTGKAIEGSAVAVDNTFALEADGGNWTRPTYGGGFWNVQAEVDRSFFITTAPDSLVGILVNDQAVPSFHNANRHYYVTVPYETKTAKLGAVLGTDGIALTGNGNKTLAVGENTFSLTATNSDLSTATYNVTITREDDTKSRLDSILVEYADGAMLNADFDNRIMKVKAGTTLADILLPLPMIKDVVFSCCDEDMDFIPAEYYSVATIRDGFRLQLVKGDKVVDEWVFEVTETVSASSDSAVSITDPTVLTADSKTHTLILLQNRTLADVVAALSLADGVTVSFTNASGTTVAASKYASTTVANGFGMQISKNGEAYDAWTFAVTTSTDMEDVGVLDMNLDKQTIVVRDGTTLENVTALIPTMDGVEIAFFDEDGTYIAPAFYADAVIREYFSMQIIKDGTVVTEWFFDTAASKTCSKHTYKSPCDTTCNSCGESREAAHTTANGICANCCQQVKTHVFTITIDQGNGLSTVYVITVSVVIPLTNVHVYDSGCDTTCNNCGAVRTDVTHTYDGISDTTCNNCGAVRDVTAPYIVIDQHTVSAGDTVEVPIRLVNNPGIVSMVIDVAYDSSVLELVESRNGNYDGNYSYSQYYTKNPYRINWYNALITYDITGDDVFATLVFKVKDNAAAGTYPFEITYKQENVYNFDFEDVVFATDAGGITVKEQDPPTIVIDDQEAKAGDTIEVPIRLVNNPGIVSMVIDVAYDSTALELVDSIGGNYDGNYSYSQYFTKNPYRINWYNALITEDIVGDDLFATLVFKVKDDAPNGEYGFTITYKQENVYNFDFEDVVFATDCGTITVETPVSTHTPGDINGDGVVNNRDYMFLTRYLNEWDVAVVEAALDITGDGVVNNRDAMTLNRYLNEWDVTIC